MTLPFQPRAIFGQQLKGSIAISKLAEAFYLMTTVLRGLRIPEDAPSWNGLTVDARAAYVMYIEHMYEQWELEQQECSFQYFISTEHCEICAPQHQRMERHRCLAHSQR